MPRSVLIVIPVVALVVVLGVGSLWMRARPPAVPPVAGDASPGVEGEPPGTVPARGRARLGRTIPVDEAIKALDLVRPSRRKMADDFSVSLLDGKKFRLSEQRGKVVFLNFWATWCPPCREEMPAMERLWRQQKEGGLVMVAVSVDSQKSVIPPFVAQHGLSFPIALDPTMDVANAYGVRALPASFVIDRDGRLAALALGPRGWDSEAAQSLIEGLAR